ncbi:hypothetical protein AYO49_00225 [Verrucomicrobiaceae bacterium SCGC AG-212-N21]|nr:hypothetical protein AYO49_00225 [Verrucomicrobiaceae bacterium SCGC AG-212-N21]
MNTALHRKGPRHPIARIITFALLLAPAGILLAPSSSCGQGKTTHKTSKTPGGGTVRTDTQETDAFKTEHVIKKNARGAMTEETFTDVDRKSGVTTKSESTYSGKASAEIPVTTTTTTRDAAGNVTSIEVQVWDTKGKQQGGYKKSGEDGPEQRFDPKTGEYSDGTKPRYPKPPLFTIIQNKESSTSDARLPRESANHARTPDTRPPDEDTGDIADLVINRIPFLPKRDPDHVVEFAHVGLQVELAGVFFAGDGSYTVTETKTRQVQKTIFEEKEVPFTHHVLVDDGVTKTLVPQHGTKTVKVPRRITVPEEVKTKHEKGLFNDTAAGFTVALGHRTGDFNAGVGGIFACDDDGDFLGGVEANFSLDLPNLSCEFPLFGQQVNVTPYVEAGAGLFHGDDSTATGQVGAGLHFRNLNSESKNHSMFVEWKYYFAPHGMGWNGIGAGITIPLGGS